MALRRRPPLRLLFDELLPPAVARALHELGFRTSHVGHAEHRQPPRGSDDDTVLRHAVASGQIIVTSNHDMILLCVERNQSVVWIDPRGRQFRLDELAVLAFGGIHRWHSMLKAESEPVCLRVMRTKVEVLPLARAAALAERRMRRLQSRAKRRVRARTEVPGQMTASPEADA